LSQLNSPRLAISPLKAKAGAVSRHMSTIAQLVRIGASMPCIEMTPARRFIFLGPVVCALYPEYHILHCASL
jgi:hypothetical protein